MKTRLVILTLLLALALGGCAGQKVVKIPDAENLFFTDTGRLIVSGGENIYEVIKTGGIFEAVSLYDGPCNFTGIAQRGNWLFSACAEESPSEEPSAWRRYLLAAELVDDEPLHFAVIHELEDFAIANGMAFNANGRLLLADSNYFGPGSVARLEIDDGSPPQVLNVDKQWLDSRHGINTPNGVRIDGNQLFLTDGGDVKRFTLDDQGDVVDQVVLVSRDTVLDDLFPACGGAIVTDFLFGQLFYVNADGDVVGESPRFAFAFPSAVAIGQGPLFSDQELLITEKGILLEMTSDFGNRLSRLELEVDPAMIEQFCPGWPQEASP